MKERPIHFKRPVADETIRAILDGRKTQERWAVNNPGFGISSSAAGCFDFRDRRQRWNTLTEQSFIETCPYGQPGDRLWVRETWTQVGTCDPGYTVYRATYPDCLPTGLENVPADIRDAGYRWTPSIHMPRWASRILLEIVSVRVERLQEISEADSMAEGAEPVLVPPDGGSCPHRQGFLELWQSINGPDSWASNPWVWVVEFKRVEGEP